MYGSRSCSSFDGEGGREHMSRKRRRVGQPQLMENLITTLTPCCSCQVCSSFAALLFSLRFSTNICCSSGFIIMAIRMSGFSDTSKWLGKQRKRSTVSLHIFQIVEFFSAGNYTLLMK